MTAYPSTIFSNSAFGAESKSCSLRENGDRLAHVLSVDKVRYELCEVLGSWEGVVGLWLRRFSRRRLKLQLLKLWLRRTNAKARE